MPLTGYNRRTIPGSFGGRTADTLDFCSSRLGKQSRSKPIGPRRVSGRVQAHNESFLFGFSGRTESVNTPQLFCSLCVWECDGWSRAKSCTGVTGHFHMSKCLPQSIKQPRRSAQGTRQMIVHFEWILMKDALFSESIGTFYFSVEEVEIGNRLGSLAAFSRDSSCTHCTKTEFKSVSVTNICTDPGAIHMHQQTMTNSSVLPVSTSKIDVQNRGQYSKRFTWCFPGKRTFSQKNNMAFFQVNIFPTLSCVCSCTFHKL